MAHNSTFLDKIHTLSSLSDLRDEWRAKEENVVFTNGCFDILHRGHIAYLTEAAQLGNWLVIGVNSDSSVSNLKGPNRPLQDQESRLEILAALQFVSAVVLFEEETPLKLIRELKPDVLVKGGDYNLETIVGAQEVLDQGGRVEVLQFLPGYSTSEIERKIKMND